jgi:Cof subfamily protein (haloacid dehalogenase superfamily)
VLRPRTIAAIAAARARGIHVIVVTGRMFRSVRPYVEEAGLDEPVICYQGAVVADPVSGEFLLHRPIELELARETIAAVEEAGFGLNCYVDDNLYVAEITEWARAYADFQNLPVDAVGDLRAWLTEPPTKLVAVGDPDELDALQVGMRKQFGKRLFISKSLPYFLEFASPEVSKGSGLAFLAERLGFTAAETVAIGDGENDRELLDWAGYAVCVEDSHPSLFERADLVIPGPEDDGVARMIESYLDLLV